MVKSPTEIIKLSSAHLTQQFEAVTEQTKELSGLAHKLATEQRVEEGRLTLRCVGHAKRILT